MELVTSLFAGPVLPATILLLLMLGWSMLAVLGTVDLDMPGGDLDLDLDVDIDADGLAAHGAGAAGQAVGGGSSVSVMALRWLNINNVPLIVWLGVFTLAWWMISACGWWLIDKNFFESPGLFWSCLLVVRNVAIALPITKWITGPMAGWFVTEQLSSGSLVGQEAEISSLEASTEFGQVKYKTDGSPLLLNVRTDGPHLARGTRVWITHYDAKNRIYIVSPTGTEAAIEDSERVEE